MNFLRVFSVVVLFLSISSLVVVVLVIVLTRKGARDKTENTVGNTHVKLFTEASNAGESSTSSNLDTQIEENSEATQRIFIENALRNPQAKLFVESNKTGIFEVYDFKNPSIKGGCYNLEKYKGRIKYVDTEESCIRLFSHSNCNGWSRALYPGSTNIPDGKLQGVQSIGPCVSNEFEYPTIIQSTSSSAPPQLGKLPSALESFANVPDLIGDAWTLSGWTSVEPSSNPLYSYLLGPGNRVEAVRGSIYPRHLKSRESAENERVAGLEQSFYSQLKLEEGDEPGFALPLELGGPADQIYNAFPQNRKQGNKFKGNTVPLVKQWLTHDPSTFVWWSVNFFYKDYTTTRPSGMWYRAELYKSKQLFYGYVPNSE